ncbi:hypothetical protein [Agromyces kandeliae]|uniref:PIN domain-containing protein n=1 Tax=Agromyces kandeliae TaxID=2666141 RepID=A0A6L5R3S8_9MICO|nr:hypothetical protein [Agromyces kandeliae]MRX44612.1 hypothetical protein [Agromyces kandeliae]
MVRRLMLDNNIWTFLVNADAVEALQLEAWSRRVEVVVPPAIVIEALQAHPQSEEGQEAKLRRIAAMTSAAWVRLMPEAYKEANEVRGEVERLRPEWINPRPRLASWNHHRKDWQSGWWDFVRKTPEEAARIHGELSDARVTRARADARQAREEARATGTTFERVSFAEAVMLVGEEPGWSSDPFDAWRGEAMNRWYAALKQSGPDHDWLAPWLNEQASDRGHWTRFWTREVDRDRVPLNWLRWAFGRVQSTLSTNDGTPVDNQIATYLPEADVFLTADKRFAACIRAVAPHSPVTLARVITVPANQPAVHETFAQLADLADA